MAQEDGVFQKRTISDAESAQFENCSSGRLASRARTIYRTLLLVLLPVVGVFVYCLLVHPLLSGGSDVYGSALSTSKCRTDNLTSCSHHITGSEAARHSEERDLTKTAGLLNSARLFVRGNLKILVPVLCLIVAGIIAAAVIPTCISHEHATYNQTSKPQEVPHDPSPPDSTTVYVICALGLNTFCSVIASAIVSILLIRKPQNDTKPGNHKQSELTSGEKFMLLFVLFLAQWLLLTAFVIFGFVLVICRRVFVDHQGGAGFKRLLRAIMFVLGIPATLAGILLLPFWIFLRVVRKDKLDYIWTHSRIVFDIVCRGSRDSYDDWRKSKNAPKAGSAAKPTQQPPQ